MAAQLTNPVRLVLAIIVGALMLVCTPSAKAGLLTTGKAEVCSTSVVQPFAPWGDTANYVLIPGGSFEAGTRAWSVSGAAGIVPGNEPYFVGSSTDSRSMALLPGSSVTTPSMCFATGDWHLRLFAVNYGAPSSQLRVRVVVRSLLGVLSVLDGGTVSSDGTWQPSPRVGLLLSNVTSLVGTSAVSFRFQPTGLGVWRIDDVYLDPWVST